VTRCCERGRDGRFLDEMISSDVQARIKRPRHGNRCFFHGLRHSIRQDFDVHQEMRLLRIRFRESLLARKSSSEEQLFGEGLVGFRSGGMDFFVEIKCIHFIHRILPSRMLKYWFKEPIISFWNFCRASLRGRLFLSQFGKSIPHCLPGLGFSGAKRPLRCSSSHFSFGFWPMRSSDGRTCRNFHFVSEYFQRLHDKKRTKIEISYSCLDKDPDTDVNQTNERFVKI